jgi:DNA repair photolyase
MESMAQTVKVTFGRHGKVYEVTEKPVPHILADSKKELHGWWPGKRACTSERMLINPYIGCSVDCFFCYAKALPGYFKLFREKGIVTVCRNFDRVVADQLDGLGVASCGYLSPVIDPFQPLNDSYRLSEKIIEAFISRNIPVEFITKERVSPEVISLLAEQPHSFGQCSILTVEESLRSRLMRGGATIDELFDNIARLAQAGVHAVCRIDPIIPYLNDDRDRLEALIRRAVDCGANHIVASVMDICLSMSKEIEHALAAFGRSTVLNIGRLYSQRIDNAYHADINYRRRLFDHLRKTCDKVGVTFALCMEYEVIDGIPVSLNPEYMSSSNCEGIDIPIYIRNGERFEPAAPCNGSCLACTDARCGIDDLALGKAGWKKPGFKLADYRRWTKELAQ